MNYSNIMIIVILITTLCFLITTVAAQYTLIQFRLKQRENIFDLDHKGLKKLLILMIGIIVPFMVIPTSYILATVCSVLGLLFLIQIVYVQRLATKLRNH